jgi:hypothetical protein
MPAATASDLRKLTLNAPLLWEHDWQGAINAASGADKLLVNIEGRAAHLLKRISDPSVTFERLAWISPVDKGFLYPRGNAGRSSAELAVPFRASSTHLL